MKDIFANLYNKVVSFFNKTDAEQSNAKDVACNRLKLVLMQDRTNLTPAIMDRMRKELIELLSKYLELDRELLDLNFEHEDNQMALMLSIPVIRAKNEDEIQEILDKEDEEKRKLEELSKSDSEEDDSEDDSEEKNDDDSKDEDDSEEDEEDDDSEEKDDDESKDEDDSEEDEEDEEEDDDNDEDDDDESDDVEDIDENTKKEKFFSKKDKK